jgi:hypothetical protein
MTKDQIIVVSVVGFVFLFAVFSLLIIRHSLKKQRVLSTAPVTLSPNNGLIVPVLAGFWTPALLSFIPEPFTISHNNTNPALELHTDHIVSKPIFKKHIITFAEINHIGIYTQFNVGSAEVLSQVLLDLEKKGMQLSSEAQNFMRQEYGAVIDSKR